MKRAFFYITFFILIVANVYTFVCGIKLSEDIIFFETETSKLHKDNMELEKKAEELSSLQYASSMAASLDFTSKITPMSINNLIIAFNK